MTYEYLSRAPPRPVSPTSTSSDVEPPHSRSARLYGPGLSKPDDVDTEKMNDKDITAMQLAKYTGIAPSGSGHETMSAPGPRDGYEALGQEHVPSTVRESPRFRTTTVEDDYKENGGGGSFEHRITEIHDEPQDLKENGDRNTHSGL